MFSKRDVCIPEVFEGPSDAELHCQSKTYEGQYNDSAGINKSDAGVTAGQWDDRPGGFQGRKRGDYRKSGTSGWLCPLDAGPAGVGRLKELRPCGFCAEFQYGRLDSDTVSFGMGFEPALMYVCDISKRQRN